MSKTNYSTTAIANVIEIRHNKPMVSSLKISELFERSHKNVLQAIRTELAEEIAGLKLKPGSYLDKQNQNRPCFWLNEEQALFVMPFIGGKKSREGQRKLVKAYLFYRDHFKDPPRAAIIKAKRQAHEKMMDALLEFRTEQGKETVDVHYMGENKLANWAVTGKFRKAIEKDLSNEDADLLEKVRLKLGAYLESGLDYETRKRKIQEFAIKERTRLIEAA